MNVDMRTRKSRCLHCGTVLDAADVVREIGRWPNGERRFEMRDDAKPRPGDFSICIRCGHLAIFGEDSRMRDPNDEEIVCIAGDPSLLAIQRARAAVMKKHGGACRHGIPLALCKQCSTMTMPTTATAVITLPDRSKERLR
jgi:hypothetical protein